MQSQESRTPIHQTEAEACPVPTCYLFCLNCGIGIFKECLIFIPPIYKFWKVLSFIVIRVLIFLSMRGAMQFNLPCFYYLLTLRFITKLFHPAHPGLVIKWAQLKFTLQVVPAAPGVSANASFHFTARVISTQHHQDTVHDGFRILVGLRQSGLCIICHVVEMKMCAIPCLLYLARILTPSLEFSAASLPHLEYNVCTIFSDPSAITICNLPLPAKLLLLV